MSILVVDDEPLIGTVLRRALSVHDVTVLDNGRAAVQLIERGALFDLVICDVVMPGMHGPRIYEEVQKIRPALCERFVFISAGVPQSHDAFFASISSPVLPKPFDVDTLRTLVGSLMGRFPC